MIPSKHLKLLTQLVTVFSCVVCSLKTSGQRPWERFVTTYRSDYKTLSERHLQVNQLNARSEATPPAFTNPLQNTCETWPILNQYFYKTTSSTYGSTTCAQPPSSYLFPPSPSPFGNLAPSVSKVTRVAGPTLTEGRTQDLRVARETGNLLGTEEKGQLHCVCGGKANVLEQQEVKDELQIDVLYEEGTIVFSSHDVPACCEDFHRSVCREAGLQHLLNLPMVFGPITTNKDAENWQSSVYLRGLRPAIRLKNSPLLQPTSRQCCCCAGETEGPKSYCVEMQTFPFHIPQGSTLPKAHVQSAVYCRKPLLTEYQASYTAEVMLLR